MRSSPLQLLKAHTFSKYFPSVGMKFFGVLVHGFLRFLRIALIRASLAGSSNASVRVLAGSSNASVLSECHLRTVSVASCRRFSSQKDLRTAARKLSGIAQLEGARGGAGEPALQGASGASHGRGMRQTLQGSFSAVSKRKFARKYAFEFL